MNKTYTYSRSNRDDNEIKIQQEQIEQYSTAKGLEINNHYSDVASGTGLGDNLQKLVEEIPSGSLLLMTERSRISRNSLKYQIVYNELSNKDVDLVFINEG